MPAERQYAYMRRSKRPFLEVKLDGENAWEYPNTFPNTSDKVPNYTVFRVAELAENWLKSRS